MLMATRKTGRSSDPALNWFCHMMLSKARSQGATQRQIAKDSGVPASAINRLLQKFDGVGTLTGRQFAKYFRCESFSEFMAAVDHWWATEGEAYARQNLARRNAEMAEALKAAREQKKPPEPIIYVPQDARPKAG